MVRHMAARLFKRFPFPSNIRSLSTKKRFYKNVSVVSSNGDYEIALDHRKLKTPGGRVFQTQSEFLAHAVSAEWLSQDPGGQLLTSQMHLTGLINTCLDNPNRNTKETIVDEIMSFLQTDTILFFSEEPEALFLRQERSWQPIIDWFNERYEMNIVPSKSITQVPEISKLDSEKLKKHLLSYNFESINGLSFGIDALKSLLLTLAVADMKLSVEEAVKLARLELQFQTDVWGNVEWAHDMELHDTTARLAAASIFVIAHNSQYSQKEKLL